MTPRGVRRPARHGFDCGAFYADDEMNQVPVAVAANRRLRGRRYHDATSAPIERTGPTYQMTPSPAEAWATTAAEKSKNMPAYAHSLSSGYPGSNSATAPSNFHTPSIVPK